MHWRRAAISVTTRTTRPSRAPKPQVEELQRGDYMESAINASGTQAGTNACSNSSHMPLTSEETYRDISRILLGVEKRDS